LAKKITLPVLKIIVSLGLFSLLFYRLGFENVLAQLATAKISWLLWGILIFSISNIFGSLQWHILLQSTGINLKLSTTIIYYYTGLFFNNFLVGYIGGDAVRVYDVSKSSGKSSDAISTVFFDRFVGFTVLTTMALGAALYYLNSSKILISISVIFLYWIFILFLLFNKNLIQRLSGLFKILLPQRFNLKMKEIYLSLNSFRHHKRMLLKIIAISFVVQFFRILVHYFAARSLGVTVNLIYFIIFVPIIALLASLPISIGGIGVRESSGVALFSQVWTIQADIVAFEFFAYLIGIISTIPGGIIFMLRKEVKRPLTNKEIIE